MRYYVRSSRYSTDYYSKHEGMTQQKVVELLEALDCGDITFITEEAWNEANPPRP